MTEKSTMHMDVRQGERISIGDVVVVVASKSGQRARLTIQAPRSTPIKRLANDEEPSKAQPAPAHG